MLSLFVFILLNQIKLFLFCQANWLWFKPVAECFHDSVLSICIYFLELITLFCQILEQDGRLYRSKRQFNFTYIVMLVVLIVMAVLFKCAVHGTSKMLRLELLGQFGEHLVLDCNLESVVLELGDLSRKSHLKIDLHNVTFCSKGFRVPVFLFETGLELALVFQLDCNFVSVLELLSDSKPAGYITANNYLPRVWHGVIFVFIVTQ